MRVKQTAEIKYKKHTNELDAQVAGDLLKKKASSVFMDSQGTCEVDGQGRRFVVLRVYGDWD